MDDIEKQIDAIKTLIDRDILNLYKGLCDSVKEVVNNLNMINSKAPDVDIEGLGAKYNECLELLGKIETVYDRGYKALGKVLNQTYTKKEKEQQEKRDEKIRQANKEHKIELEKLKAECERAKVDAQTKNKVEFDIHNIERSKLSKEIKELKAEIDKLNKRVKDAEAEADRAKLELSFKTQALENSKKESAFFCDSWEKEIEAREKEKTKRCPKITAGKTAALPPSVIEEIIKSYCQGLSKHKTAKMLEGKATRNQVYRVLNGNYKNSKSIEKIKKVVRGLKKKNQNPEFLKKLDAFLLSYSTPQPPNQSL